MWRVLLLSLWIVPVFGQSLAPETPAFEPILSQILAAVKIGTVPSIEPKTWLATGPPMPGAFVGVTPLRDVKLPGAFACWMTQVLFGCTWEAKPNKYSVAVLLDDIVTRVSAALPKTWTRETGQDAFRRYGVFTDPAAGITITISCQATEANIALDSYTVTLNIHPSALRII